MNVELTMPEGNKVSVDTARVIRIRRTTYGEGPDAKTRVDWSIMSLVKEPVEVVAEKIKAGLPTLAKLTSRDETPIWFNAKKAQGPLPISESDQPHLTGPV